MGAAERLIVDTATDYARQVSTGAIVAGPWVRMACKRHLDNLVTGHQRGLVWHPGRAEHALEFIQCLRHYQGATAGQRFILSAWQRFVVGSLFGWYAQDEQRRFRIAYVEIGKGNGKTPLAAAVALYALVADGEAGAEIYSAATSREQAGICFNDCKQFVLACPPLLNRLSISGNNIAYLATSSYLRTVSAEGRGLDGKRPHVVIVDELHEHPNAIVVEKMRAGTKGRTRALIFEITNSGYDQTTVCFEHHDYSIKVLQGVIENDSWFAYIAALDKGDDPFANPDCWLKANPNLGVSVTRQYLEEQVREARDINSKRNMVLRLNFCRWTEASEGWGDVDHWDQCAGPVHAPALAGRACYGGLDLASTSDFSALCLVFPPLEPSEPWQLLLRLYLPEDAVRKLREKGRLPVDTWIEQGLITVTPGNVTDYGYIKRDLIADKEKYDIKEVAFDRFNSSQLVNDLQAEEILMVAFGQGFASMSAPIKELERIYMSHNLAHGGHKVLRWMFTNVVAVKDPAENVKFDKAKSTQKIDGMQALAMAIGRAIAAVERAKTFQMFVV